MNKAMFSDAKVCGGCKKEQPSSEYYKDAKYADRLGFYCKDCLRAKRSLKKESLSAYRKEYQSRENIKERRKGWNENYKEKYNAKIKARKRVEGALLNGSLIKPSDCDCCETEHIRMQSHHSDYSKPLDVLWLCEPCHKELHVNLRRM